MSSLVAWIGVDQRGPSSAYIATDSRISWSSGDKISAKWDHGRKVFGGRHSPELFGYVGDVLSQSMILGQISDLPTSNSQSITFESIDQRFEDVGKLIESSIKPLSTPHTGDAKIIHVIRIAEGMETRFACQSIEWMKNKWIRTRVNIPTSSEIIVACGSGAEHVLSWKMRWNSSMGHPTSRAIFSAFCDSIEADSDKFSGGFPQLYSLHRKGGARPIGVFYNGQSSILGLNISEGILPSLDLDWRNPLFERCDRLGNLLKGTQRHSKPMELRNSGQASEPSRPFFES